MGDTHSITMPDGAVLSAETAGAGAPLVLVPGAGGDRSTWDSVWPRLTEMATCVRYDLRGAAGVRATATFRHADDLRALLDGLSIRRSVVIGVSMGGRIAIDFALDHPDRVRALVLINPGLADWDWSPDWQQRWDELTEVARDGRLDVVRDLWFHHPVHASTRRNPTLAAQLRAAIAEDSCMVWLDGDKESPPPQPHVERLHELAMPIVLISGADDLEDFRIIAEVITASVAGVHRVDLDGTGHLAHLERPTETIAAIATLLTRTV